MPKIKNVNYRMFLDEGIIKIVEEADIFKALGNIKGKRAKEGRALVILLYYTGARPIEALNLKAMDISKKDTYVVIKFIKTWKQGLPRTIYLPYSKALVKEFYQYATSVFPDLYLFYNFKNKYKRLYKSKKGEIKEYIEETNKLPYYFKKWFKGIIDISPYYLRHNRFSKLSQEGITDSQLQYLKGAKSVESVRPYKHMSSLTAKKLARKMK